MGSNTLIIWLWEESVATNRPASGVQTPPGAEASGDNGERLWRGCLSHVQSGRLVHFQTLKDLYQRIDELLGET